MAFRAKNTDKNAEFKTLDAILDEPLSALRMGLHGALAPGNQRYNGMLGAKSADKMKQAQAQMSKPYKGKFDAQSFEAFLDQIEHVVTQDNRTNITDFRIEKQRVLKAVATGEVAGEPKTRRPANQLMWAAALGHLTASPEAQEKWPKENTCIDITDSKVWQSVEDSQFVEGELLDHAFHLAQDIGKKDTRLRWGAPGSWFYSDRENDIVNLDLIGALTLGLEHTRSAAYHEIGHSKLTLDVSPRLRDIIETFEEQDKRVKKGGKLTQEEYVERQEMSVEMHIRNRLWNSSEDNCVNRYAINKSGAQDHSYSINVVNALIAGTGTMALKVRENGGNPLDIDEEMITRHGEGSISEEDPTELAKEASKKVHNLTHMINMSVFQHNGMFDNTREGWESIGVNVNAITEDPNYPGATGQTPEEALQHIRSLCHKMEDAQPGRRERMSGKEGHEAAIQEHFDTRMEIQEEIWDRYMKQHAEVLMEQAREKAQDKVDKNNEKKEQQEKEKNQEQDQSQEQGEGQEQDGEGQDGEGQEQEGQEQGEGQDQDGEGQQGEGQQQGQGQQSEGQQGQQGQGQQSGQEQGEGQEQGSDDQQQDGEGQEQSEGQEQGESQEQGDGQDQNGQEQGEGQEQGGEGQEQSGGGDGSQEQEGGDSVPVEGFEDEQEDRSGNRPHSEEHGEGQEQDGQEQGDGQDQDGEGQEQGEGQDGQEKSDGQDQDGEGQEQGDGQEQGEGQGQEQGEGQEGEGQDGEGQDGQGQDGQQGKHKQDRTVEELMDKRRKEQEEAKRKEESEKGEPAKPDPNSAGSIFSEGGNTHTLDDLPVGNWEEYGAAVAEYAGPINQLTRVFERLRDKKFETQKQYSNEHDILPDENGLSTFNPAKEYERRKKELSGEKLDEDDFKRFRHDADVPKPAADDLVVAIDLSGSMTEGNAPNRRIDMALQSACIMFEAGKKAGMNVYICGWGDTSGPRWLATPEMRDKEIGANIVGVRDGAGYGTKLAPAFTATEQNDNNQGIVEMMSKVKGDGNTMVGDTHMMVISDGDLGDEKAAGLISERLLKAVPNMTLDIAVINDNEQNAISKMAQSVKGGLQKRVGIEYATEPQAVQSMIIDSMSNRVRASSTEPAILLEQKRQMFGQALKKLERPGSENARMAQTEISR